MRRKNVYKYRGAFLEPDIDKIKMMAIEIPSDFFPIFLHLPRHLPGPRQGVARQRERRDVIPL